MEFDETVVDNFIKIVGTNLEYEEVAKYLRWGKGDIQHALNYYFKKQEKTNSFLSSCRQSADSCSPDKPATQSAFEELRIAQRKQQELHRTVAEMKQLRDRPIGSAVERDQADASRQLCAQAQVLSSEAANMPDFSSVDYLPHVLNKNNDLQNKPIFQDVKLDYQRNDAQPQQSDMSVEFQALNSQENAMFQNEAGFEEQLNLREQNQQQQQAFTAVSMERREAKTVSAHTQSLPQANGSREAARQASANSTLTTAKRRAPESSEQSPAERDGKLEDNLEIASLTKEAFPLRLGSMIIQGSATRNVGHRIQRGDVVHLKVEHTVKQTKIEANNVAKKGRKGNTQDLPNIIRIIWQDFEIFRVDNEYSKILYPLLDRNYIFVEGVVEACPLSIKVFSNIQVKVKKLPNIFYSFKQNNYKKFSFIDFC